MGEVSAALLPLPLNMGFTLSNGIEVHLMGEEVHLMGVFVLTLSRLRGSICLNHLLELGRV